MKRSRPSSAATWSANPPPPAPDAPSLLAVPPDAPSLTVGERRGFRAGWGRSLTTGRHRPDPPSRCAGIGGSLPQTGPEKPAAVDGLSIRCGESLDLGDGAREAVRKVVFCQDEHRPSRCLEGLVPAAVAEDLGGEQVVSAVVLDGQPPTAIPKVRGRASTESSGRSRSCSSGSGSPASHHRQAQQRLRRGIGSHRISPTPPGRGRFPADSGGAQHRTQPIDGPMAPRVPPNPSRGIRTSSSPMQTRSPDRINRRARSSHVRGRVLIRMPSTVSLRLRTPAPCVRRCPYAGPRAATAACSGVAPQSPRATEARAGIEPAAVTCEIQAPGDAADSARAAVSSSKSHSVGR